MIIPLIYVDIDSALYYGNQAIRVASDVEFPLGKAIALSGVGYIYMNQNRYIEALDKQMESLKIAQNADLEPEALYAKNYISGIYSALGEYEKALNGYRESLILCNSIKEFRPVFSTWFGMAKVYREKKDYDSSIYAFDQGRMLSQHNDKSFEMSRAINQIGRNYLLKQDYARAIDYFEEALIIRQNNKNVLWILTSERDLGETYLFKGDYAKAHTYLTSSLHKSDSLHHVFGSIPTLLTLARLYNKTKKYDLEISCLTRGLKLVQDVGRAEQEIEILKKLSKAYNYSRQPQLAFEMTTIADSLIKKQGINSDLQALEAKFELRLMENELANKEANVKWLKNKEKAERRSKYALIGIAVMLLFSLMLIFQRFKTKAESEKELSEKNSLIETQKKEIVEINKELEKRMLRAQMDPHFIFNSLNAIQHFITANDKTSALKYLSRFGRLIRQILENSVIPQVPIADELSLLENYIALEALRFADQFQYTIDVDEDLNVHDIEVPFLLIQPYVENAIIHGLRHMEGEGKLCVALQLVGEYIYCTVEDNGIGRKRSAEIKNNGITKNVAQGMSITARRLELLNNDGESKTEVVIEDVSNPPESSGTRVTLKIPVDLN